MPMGRLSPFHASGSEMPWLSRHVGDVRERREGSLSASQLEGVSTVVGEDAQRQGRLTECRREPDIVL